MIEYRQGNLLEADAEALINAVNCVGVMGKGIARQFKQAFPDNFRAYVQACRAGAVQPRQLLTVATNCLTNPHYIINFPTKRHWRDLSRLEDITTGLDALVVEIERLDLCSLAVPALGCGNGGLAWTDVRPRIEAALVRLPNVQVFVYEPTRVVQDT